MTAVAMTAAALEGKVRQVTARACVERALGCWWH
jgi:hypothetical protein